ncbi:hypothetical protein ACFC1R_31280 [Kitasatospora sp. NPDC056138]|uniref:hypothetical protein n=1 Tax=Kitasatospora sp. NPDC056138 TaxID=3345724 RepID=UPI0035E306B0
MPTKSAPVTCQFHEPFAQRCTIDQPRTTRENLLALLQHYTHGPLDLGHLHRPDTATHTALNLLAHLLNTRPTTLRRHLRGTRRPAGRKLRAAVTDLFRREFCVQNQLDTEVRRVREESGRARRRAVLAAREEEDQWLRQAVLKRYLES